MLIGKTTINNTPVLSATTNDPEFGRVLGAVRVQNTTWVYPAYLPFLPKVLSDLSIIDPGHTFTADARAYLDSIKTYEQWREYVATRHFPTKSRDHQLDGTAELLTNHRWFLRWGMGVGKTKIAIDTLNILKVPALVLCPKVAVDNWMGEIEKHGGGTLRALAFDGATRKKRLKQFQQFSQQDIIVTTYDAARLWGIPSLPPAATKALVDARRVLPPVLRQAFYRLNDPEVQSRLVQEWLKGRNPKEIVEESAALHPGHAQYLVDWPYHMLLCDESHRIKRIQSDRTGIILKMSSRAARRVLMSGTPIQGNPKDAYPQLKFIAPYTLKWDWRGFCKEFVITRSEDDNMVLGYKNLHILNRIINSVGSQRELADCVDLPKRTISVVNYKLSPEQQRAYNTAVQHWTVFREDGSAFTIVNAANRIAKLLQICSGFTYIKEDTGICDACPHVTDCIEGNIQPGTPRCLRREELGEIPRSIKYFKSNPKLAALQDFLEDLIPTNKVIIWATFTAELDQIEDALQTRHIGYVRVDGDTVSGAAAMANTFNTSDDVHVYLAHISTGISITLNSAAYMIYYSRGWDPDSRNQSMARNYRIGQTAPTFVYDLCATGTVEVQQLAALDSKEDISVLLTKKMDCVLCSRYAACVKTNITPWDEQCMYSKTAYRVIAKAEILEEE